MGRNAIVYHPDKVVVSKRKDELFWWKRMSANGTIVGESHKGYHDKRNCLQSFMRSLETNYVVKGCGLNIKGIGHDDGEE